MIRERQKNVFKPIRQLYQDQNNLYPLENKEVEFAVLSNIKSRLSIDSNSTKSHKAPAKMNKNLIEPMLNVFKVLSGKDKDMGTGNKWTAQTVTSVI